MEGPGVCGARADGNSVTQSGGALDLYRVGPQQIIAENNTFYNNLAGLYGGAIYTGGSLTSENNAFSTNQVNQSSGIAGASLFIYPGGTTAIYNNIFANSTGWWGVLYARVALHPRGP